ncbi:hypothetical protein [Streptomyces sp. NPDC007369]
MTPEQVRSIVRAAVVGVLLGIRSAGPVHRDLKPCNVLCTLARAPR